MDVWAFANKALGLSNNLDKKSRSIYDAQPDHE
jgi:hypothetical protein